jgi:cell division initiation protein
MKLTPTAIRQKSFETGFRGFEKTGVSAFLDELSQVVDVLNRENMDLKNKLQNTEAEAKRLKDVEDSLFRTLKTAEDTGAAIIEEANEAADLIINAANELAANTTENANMLLFRAREQAEQAANTLISAAETKAKETILELRESMQGLVRSYEGLVDQREAMVKSLRRTAQDALNQIDLSDAHFNRIDAKAHQRAIEELGRSQTFTFANISSLNQVALIPRKYQPASQEDPYVEMKTIEEETGHEIQHESPNSVMDVEEEVLEKDEIKGDSKAKKEEFSESNLKTAERPTREEPSKKPEDPKNQSGSFFNQFD